ncbi:lactate dehydrogenase [Wukongibacter baidiensis]|uniref:lactate/malate family dehydrogenase n=1 Tax=Wukongibacter baidiensis TaxID=1723361 RepID=UPI003D800141
MFYYILDDKILFSKIKYDDLEATTEDAAKEHRNKVYFLKKMNPLKSRRSFSLSDPSLMDIDKEELNLLEKGKTVENTNLPEWIIDKIDKRQVTCINTEYPRWKEVLNHSYPDKWKVNVLGLGDVGGTLITGLRLLGGDCISEIGIYDRNENKKVRWALETNQILSAFDNKSYPKVKGITAEELFDCDMFVFCASVGVPPVGQEEKDVRMIQFEGNSKILSSYAKLAREKGFTGSFAVVSDPVDLLCKSVFINSNLGENGEMDYFGLAPEQIRGYGLGVMHARAAYYAGLNRDTDHYVSQGRAYGPHGKGLVIADSIENYNEEKSLLLTKKAKEANLEVREAGFKPYIAPALSSGSLSLLATIRGEWNYSTTYMGGAFMGAKNRLISSGLEIERLNLPDELLSRLKETYDSLRSII